MSETGLLQLLIVGAYVLGPRVTRRLLSEPGRLFDAVHLFGLVCVVASLVLPVRWWSVGWLAVSLFGIGSYVLGDRARLLSWDGLARGIPFAFSLVSAVWFVAGSNDLRLLGYDTTFSAYATLHGAVLGWSVIGSAAVLGYRWACVVSLPLFLCVAFGIDGVPHIKWIGTVGLTVVVLAILGRRVRELPGRQGISLVFAWASLVAVVVSMTLALLHAFAPGFPPTVLGLPTMVVVHGALNALVVAPGLFLSIVFEGRPDSPDPRSADASDPRDPYSPAA